MKASKKENSTGTKSRPRGRQKWTRFSPEDREELILQEAVHFFAEHGFEAQTRDLAKRIGVSQGLIYRYFRTKDDLIEKVYQRVYMKRWNIYWEELLANRARSLELRLKEFYRSYIAAVDDHDWMRIAVYSGLKGNNLVNRYIKVVFEHVIQVVSTELRHDCGLPAISAAEIPKLDLELTWNLHATMIYFLMRRYVFKIDPSENNDAVAEQAVDQMLPGTLRMLRERYPREQDAPSGDGRVSPVAQPK
jgi:AcrR family transcriptional regulator